MANFIPFAEAVHSKYLEMADSRHFTTEITKEELRDLYIASFPEGTDPVYISEEHTTHTCSCCFNFIGNLGRIVTIKDGQLTSVWDVEGLEYPYDVVAKAMHEAVVSTPIQSVYYTSERKYGAKKTTQTLEDHSTIDWNHFYGQVGNNYFVKDPNKQMGYLNGQAGVFKRALTELTSDALSIIIELINEDNLARGPEFKEAVKDFAAAKELVADCSPEKLDLFCWENCDSPVTGFRNTAIGSLAVDLSEGVELEVAVAKFEAKVAGDAYKRPKALITQKQRDALIKQIDDNGLRPALPRRHATLSDVSTNDVLWVDNETGSKMADPLEALLDTGVKAPSKAPDMSNATEIDHADFVKKVLPEAISVQMLLEREHLNHFMSMTAPINADAPKLFHWDNNMAWAYDGDVAESVIAKRVKAAGGNVDNALMRVSLSWENTDDLDIHVITPWGEEIYYGNRSGVLDVDANAGGRHRTDPVENMAFMSNLRDGVYEVRVKQFSLRNRSDYSGFKLEVVDASGFCRVFAYNDQLSESRTMRALSISVKDGSINDLKVMSKDLVEGDAPNAEKWGVSTNTFVDVATVVHSPNHWEGAGEKGNKHTFYILKDCLNPEPVRGIFNEFLGSKHKEYRKGFEVLGAATKCEYSDDQMSGIGYSHTQRGEINFLVTLASGQTVAYKVKH